MKRLLRNISVVCTTIALVSCGNFPIVTKAEEFAEVYVPPNVWVTAYDSVYDLQKAVGCNTCVGKANWKDFGAVCLVWTIRDPKVLLHELRHCSEEAWHGNYAHSGLSRIY